MLTQATRKQFEGEIVPHVFDFSADITALNTDLSTVTPSSAVITTPAQMSTSGGAQMISTSSGLVKVVQQLSVNVGTIPGTILYPRCLLTFSDGSKIAIAIKVEVGDVNSPF